MKVCLVLLSAVCLAVSEAPVGWRPSGRLLLLPARQEEIPAPATPTQVSDESESEKIVDSGEYYVLLSDGRLQMVKYSTAALKEEGKDSSSGSSSSKYTAPTATGNFQQQQQQSSFQQQSSKYTAPATENFQQQQTSQQQQSSFQQGQQQQSFQSAQYRAPNAQPEPFAQFQVEYVQFPLPGSQYTQTKLQYTEEPQTEAEEKEDSEKVTGYQTNLQYRDVKPISAPVYAHNPSPLVRILKK